MYDYDISTDAVFIQCKKLYCPEKDFAQRLNFAV
jgi:hypothetical protein